MPALGAALRGQLRIRCWNPDAIEFSYGLAKPHLSAQLPRALEDAIDILVQTAG